MPKITKRIVDAAHPKGRRYFIWDTSLPGFGLVVQATGTKSYCFQYRTPEGRSRRTAIGRHGEALTAEQAREKAKEFQAKVFAGRDPLGEEQQRKGALTVAQLLDLYLASGKFAEKTEDTRKCDAGRVEHHLKPLLGRIIADKLRFDDLRKAKTAIEEGRTAKRVRTGPRGVAKVTGGAGAARMALRLIKSAYSWAANPDEGGLLTANPTAGFKVGQDGVRDVVISGSDYSSLFKAIEELEALQAIRSTAADAIRVIALTGARRGEIAGLKWKHVKLKKGLLEIPPEEHKTGRKTQKPRAIGLPASAQIIISSQPAGLSDGFVFPPAHGKGPIRLNKPMRAVRSKAGLPPGSGLHVLRHSLATSMAESSRQAPEIMTVLGHKNMQTSQKYVHIAQERRAGLAEQAAAGISAALAGKRGKLMSIK